MHWSEMTNEQALAAWDAGDLVWTCSMGGMGPGYEQAIQMMGFAFLREMVADQFDYESDSEDRDKWRAYTDQIEATPAAKAIVEKIGPSGAQFSAAMNIASVFARNGYAKGMETVPEDRRMMVNRTFPADVQ